jgi:tetratricopeptide (TPR) repeat protein
MKSAFIALTLIVAVALHSYACAVERPVNELPMYGGQHNPSVGTNKANSKSAAELGWKYYYSGDLDTAMKRFNQAWMFDRENVDALWGFGLIMGQRASQEDTEKNLRESIKYLAMANARSPKNARILVDLAFSHTILGDYLLSNKKSAKDEFNKARTLFQQAEKLEPEYPLVYSNWSVLEFYTGNYSSAKKLLAKSKKLGFKPDPAYEKDLMSK